MADQSPKRIVLCCFFVLGTRRICLRHPERLIYGQNLKSRHRYCLNSVKRISRAINLINQKRIKFQFCLNSKIGYKTGFMYNIIEQQVQRSIDEN